MSEKESQRDEHRQPGPGGTAQGGPRSAGEEGGTGPSSERDREREEREERERKEGDGQATEEQASGRQAGSGAARSQ